MANSLGVVLLAGSERRARRVADRLEAIEDRFAVTTTTSVEHAIDAVLESPDSSLPDCLVTEQTVGETDGLSVLDRVRAGPGQVPVVFFPVDGDEDLASKTVTAGASGYVPNRSDAASTKRLADGIRTAIGDTTLENEAGGDSGIDHGQTDDGEEIDRDRSNRRQVEAELEHERDRLSVLFENMPDPTVHVTFQDDDPIVKAVNPAFEETFGYSTADIRGKSVNEYIVPPEERNRARELDRKAMGGQQTRTELRRQTADGFRHFLFRGVTISRSDDATEGFGIYADITEQKTRARQLQVLNRVLRHNLRNDMNVIIGNAQRLQEGLPESERQYALERIVETGTTVANTSEKVRTIASALDVETDESEIDAVALLERTIDDYRELDHVSITTSVPDQAPVEADERLVPVIENLLENTIEHSEKSCVSIDVRIETDADQFVDIVLRDDGPGIPTEERNILEGKQEINHLVHGSGLGLWLVDWIVTTLGGEVSFDVDNGTTVRIRLPAAD